MRDGMMRPEAQRFELGGGARLVLGPYVIAGFLQPEAVEGQQGAVARLVLGPEWQGARRTIPNPRETTEEPVDQGRRLMRDNVERVIDEMAFEHRDGSGPGALDQIGERSEMGLLALVQRKTFRGFDR